MTGVIVAADSEPGLPALRELPAFDEDGSVFVPVAWSPDGRFVAGMLRTRTDERSGITLFDLEEDLYVRLTLDVGQLPD